MRATRTQERAKDREVLTPPRKKVKAEEMPKGIRKALPTKFPPTNEGRRGGGTVTVPPLRMRPLLVKHVAGVWENRHHMDLTRVEDPPPTRMLIRHEDAASMVSPPGPLARGK